MDIAKLIVYVLMAAITFQVATAIQLDKTQYGEGELVYLTLNEGGTLFFSSPSATYQYLGEADEQVAFIPPENGAYTVELYIDDSLISQAFFVVGEQGKQAAFQLQSQDTTTWYNTSWTERRTLNITSASSASNVTLAFEVYAGMGSEVNESIYCDSSCKSDFSDVIFTDSSSVPMPQFVEIVENDTRAYFWVQIPSLTIGNTEIHVYFNNSEGALSSNASLVFEAFEGFEVSNSFTSGTKTLIRTCSSGAITGSCFADGGDASQTHRVAYDNSQSYTSDDHIVEGWVQYPANEGGNGNLAGGLLFAGQASGNNGYQIILDGRGADSAQIREDTNFASRTDGSTSTTFGTWYFLRAFKEDGDLFAQIYDDIFSSPLSTTTRSAEGTYSSGRYGVYGFDNNNQRFDNIRVRKAPPTNLSYQWYDTTKPLLEINITFPLPELYPELVTSFDFVADGLLLSSCAYSLDGGATNTSSSCSASIPVNISNGTSTFVAYALSGSGLIVSDSVTFSVDPNFPTIDVFSPTDAAVYSQQQVLLNFVASDDNLDVCQLQIDASPLQTSSCSLNVSQNFSEGPHSVTFFANDTSANLINETVAFIVDTSPPQIVVSSPANASTFEILDVVNLAFNTSDATTSVVDAEANITWPNASTQVISLVQNGQEYTALLQSSNSVGPATISISVSDQAGNSVSTSRQLFFEDTQSPTAIIDAPAPGAFDLLDEFNSTIIDPNLDSCLYQIAPVISWTPFDCSSASLNLTDNSSYTLQVFANDTSGNSANVSVEFFLGQPTPQASFVGLGDFDPVVFDEPFATISSQVNQAILPFGFFDVNQDVLLWLRFNDSLSDSSFFERSFSGSASYSSGRFGSGGNLSNSVISSSSSDFELSSQFAFSVWVKPADVDDFQVLVNKQGATFTDRNYWLALWDDGSAAFRTSFSGSLDCDLRDSQDLRDGEWHHVVAVYSSSGCSLYVNSILVDSGSVSGTPDTQTSNFYVGSETGTSRFYEGLIDELVVFSRNLSSIEVGNLYNLSTLTNFTLSAGNYSLSLRGSDVYGNVFTSTRQVVVNSSLFSQAPQVSILYPQNVTYAQAPAEINFSAFDLDLDSCLVSFDGGTTNSSTACNQSVIPPTAQSGANTWILYANDSAGNWNSSSVTFIFDIGPAPNVTIVSPLRGSGVVSSSSSVEFLVEDDDLISSCVLLEDSSEITSVATPSKNESIFFVSANSVIGTRTLTVECIDIDGLRGNDSVFFSVLDSSGFEGSLPDLSSVNISNITGFQVNSLTSTISFLESLDLSSGISFSDAFVLGARSVTADSFQYPSLNVSANITFSQESFSANPSILRNGITCGDCSTLSLDPVIIQVPHFTTYSITENSRMVIFDSSDALGGSVQPFSYDLFTLYSNYTNTSSALPITGATCEATIFGQTNPMSYDATSQTYTYETFSNQSGIFEYNVSCQATGYEAINSSDAIRVFSSADRWYDVSVQRGSVEDTSATISAFISSVSPENSFVLFTDNTASSQPEDRGWTFDFSSSTQVDFERYASGSVSNISYEVITSEGISTQHIEETFSVGQATRTIDINNSNPELSFILVDGRCDSTNNANNNAAYFRAGFINSTSVFIERGNQGDCAATAKLQVIEWSGVRVRSGNSTIPSGSDSSTETLTPVTLARSFLTFSHSNLGSDTGMDSNLIQGSIPTSGSVTFTKEPGTTLGNSDRYVDWFVVELPGGTVQSGDTALASDTTQSLTSVNLSRSFHLGSGWNTGGGQTYQNSAFTTALTDSTTLTFDKSTGSQTQNIHWYVAETPVGDVIPSFNNLSAQSPSPANYSPSGFVFNATITGSSGDVFLFFDSQSFLASNASATAFSASIPAFSPGNYSYFWAANGSGIYSPYNQSEEQLYEIVRSGGVVDLLVNGSSLNQTFQRTSSANIVGSLVEGQTQISLYENGSLIFQNATLISFTKDFDEVGTFVYLLELLDSQNYTGDSQTVNITVVDTVSPEISNLQNVSITDTSVIIQWDTNELANASVAYGTSLLNESAFIESYGTIQSVALTSLSPNTTYFYQATSCDPYSNCNTSSTYNFTTLLEPDLTAPSFLSISEQPLQNEAYILTNLSEPANVSVSYGTTPSFGSTVDEVLYLDEHNITLSGLSALTLYYYELFACDPSNNCNTSQTLNFTTLDLTAPAFSDISSFPLSPIGFANDSNHTFNSTWVDNIGVDVVLIESNFSGIFTNTSLVGGPVYSYSASNLSSGLYSWRMIANDSSDNINSTPFQSYEVVPLASSVQLSMNGSTQSTINLSKKDFINLTATSLVPGEATVQILVDDVVVDEGPSPLTVNQTFLFAGDYDITARVIRQGEYAQSDDLGTVFVTAPTITRDTERLGEIVTTALTSATSSITLENTYNLSQAFFKIYWYFDGSTTNPSQSAVSAYFSDSNTLTLERGSGTNTAQVSVSIIEANNIAVYPFNYSWSLAEESASVEFSQLAINSYADKCFIETRRNGHTADSSVESFSALEIQATFLNATHLSLQRDVEGAGSAAAATQRGFVVCFLDEGSSQSTSFSIQGDAGTEELVPITSTAPDRTFTTFSHYQADAGVGQNSFLVEVDSPTSLRVHRDENGGGQIAYGAVFAPQFEDVGQSEIDIFRTVLPVSSNLTYTFGLNKTYNANTTFLNCENTMESGGGTAFTRSYYTYAFNSSGNGLVISEGRTRTGSQVSDIMCTIITWPSQTSYIPAAELSVDDIAVPSMFVENQAVEFNFTIANDGEVDAELFEVDVLVEYNNGTGFEYLSNETFTVPIVEANTSLEITRNITFISGPNRIRIAVDFTDVVEETDEDDNNLTYIVNGSTWQIYHGSVLTLFRVLSDGGLTNFTSWSEAVDTGNILISDNDVNLDYLSLLPLSDTDDFDDADTVLGISSHVDNIQALYDSNDDGIADQTEVIVVAGSPLSVPIANSSNGSDFTTGILYDSSGGVGFDGSQPLVFISVFNGTKTGAYGNYEFEIRVPSSLKSQFIGEDTVSIEFELT